MPKKIFPIGTTSFSEVVNDLHAFLTEKEGMDLKKTELRNILKLYHETIIENVEQGYAFNMPGIVKLSPKLRPARKGGQKMMSFGKEIITTARPASYVAKARPLKNLKEAISGLKA